MSSTEMAEIITNSDGELEMSTHNYDTGKMFNVKVISMRSGTNEYLMEVRDIASHEKVVFKNWVAIKKPKNEKKSPALSPLLATLMLLGTTAVVGAAFVAVSVDNTATIDSFLDVLNFEIVRFSNSENVLASIEIMTNRPQSISLGGDIKSTQLTDSSGGPLNVIKTEGDVYFVDLDSDAIQDGKLKVTPHIRGTLISYEGVIELQNPVGEKLSVEITSDGISKVYVFRVDQK